MASIGAGYDLSPTTYSPEGRIFQIEYAQKATEASGTIVGIKAKDGIVLAVEKPILSKLLKPNSNRRIATVDLHAGMVGAGLAPDCRQLANHARSEASQHRDSFNAPIPGQTLADRVGLFLQTYTMYSSVRPFGANAILGVVDRDGPHLYMMEPSGVFWGYQGCAAGKGRQVAKSELEKLNFDEIDTAQAVKEAARIIYMSHDEAKDKEFELELSWIGPHSNNMHQLVPQAILNDAIEGAKQFMLARMEYD